MWIIYNTLIILQSIWYTYRCYVFSEQNCFIQNNKYNVRCIARLCEGEIKIIKIEMKGDFFRFIFLTFQLHHCNQVHRIFVQF